MKSPLAKYGLWTLGWVVAGVLVSRVEPFRYEGSRARDEQGRELRNHSALAAMLGEFRTSASDLMFIQTERYLHGGISFRKGTSVELAEGHDDSDLDHDHDDGDGHDHTGDHDHDAACSCHGADTAIPRKENDFRGWVGDLYREVKPWNDPSKPHIHTDGKELLPWFRLMTMSDPHYVQGYLAGAYWLQMESLPEAMAFVEEGIKNNPDAFQLYASRGFLRMKVFRHSNESTLAEEDRKTVEQARNDFLQAAEMGLAQRPVDVGQDGTHGTKWLKYHENDLLAACRMTVVLTERLGDIERAKRYRERFSVMGPLFSKEEQP